jgi:hypothetical protein
VQSEQFSRRTSQQSVEKDCHEGMNLPDAA